MMSSFAACAMQLDSDEWTLVCRGLSAAARCTLLELLALMRLLAQAANRAKCELQVREFIASAKSAAHAHGEVRTMTGRRRPLQGINSADRRCSAPDCTPRPRLLDPQIWLAWFRI